MPVRRLTQRGQEHAPRQRRAAEASPLPAQRPPPSPTPACRRRSRCGSTTPPRGPATSCAARCTCTGERGGKRGVDMGGGTPARRRRFAPLRPSAPGRHLVFGAAMHTAPPGRWSTMSCTWSSRARRTTGGRRCAALGAGRGRGRGRARGSEAAATAGRRGSPLRRQRHGRAPHPSLRARLSSSRSASRGTTRPAGTPCATTTGYGATQTR